MRLYEGFILRRERVQLLGNLVDVALSVARNGLAYWYLLNMALDQGLSASEFLLYFSAIGGFANWITGILNDSMTLRREALDLTSIREYLEIEEAVSALQAASSFQRRTAMSCGWRMCPFVIPRQQKIPSTE